MGYFITTDGKQKALSYTKQHFTEKELRAIFRSRYMLEPETDDLINL